jgi:20S proteasome subunit beta 5
VIPIASHIMGTMAGGAADCSYWLRALSAYLKVHEGPITVHTAAKVLANLLHKRAKQGLSVGTMIMGWENTANATITDVSDDSTDATACGCGQLYYVDNSGSRIKGSYFAVGSGSSLAYGILDAHYKPSLSIEQAAAVCKSAVVHAAHRDAYSGGYINVYHISAAGINQLSRQQTAAIM